MWNLIFDRAAPSLSLVSAPMASTDRAEMFALVDGDALWIVLRVTGALSSRDLAF